MVHLKNGVLQVHWIFKRTLFNVIALKSNLLCSLNVSDPIDVSWLVNCDYINSCNEQDQPSILFEFR